MDAIYRKISWRLLPLLMLCCVVAYIDRVNVDLAQRHIQDSLAFGNQVFAWGAGVFFFAYALFAVPCNLLLEKLGTRKILLRMMLGWGAATAAGAFVRTPLEYYTIRFLLGMCEAGFFPGVILYLTYWYPAARRARVFAVFASATLIGGIVAGPLSDALRQALHLHSGMQGWQWLLLAQGLPAALLGIAAYFYLDDHPDDAKWLSGFEQQMVRQDLNRDETALAKAAGIDEDDDEDEPPSSFSIIWSLLRDPAICLLALANLMLAGASYALAHWVPALMQRWGAGGPQQPDLLAAIPGIVGIVGMIAIGYDSDRRRERRGHFIACMVLAAGGLGLAIAADNGLAWSLAGLSLASLGVSSALPLLVAILTDLLNRQRAAAGIALVGGLAMMGGAFGPALSARMLAWGDSAAMFAALICMYLAAGLVLMLALRMAPRRGGPDAKDGLRDKMARN